jgi:hypothetical protein
LLLLAEGVDRILPCGVRGGRDSIKVGACELAVIVQSVLQDVDDCLLKSDDLGLELVFGERWGLSALPSHSTTRYYERTIANGESTPQFPISLIVLPLYHCARHLEIATQIIAAPGQLVLALLECLRVLLDLLPKLLDFVVL